MPESERRSAQEKFERCGFGQLADVAGGKGCFGFASFMLLFERKKTYFFEREEEISFWGVSLQTLSGCLVRF